MAAPATSDRQLDRAVRGIALRDEVPLADAVLAPGAQDDPAVAEAEPAQDTGLLQGGAVEPVAELGGRLEDPLPGALAGTGHAPQHQGTEAVDGPTRVATSSRRGRADR
ncbi:hypothetical protein [Streptomyces sp. NPDC002172]